MQSTEEAGRLCTERGGRVLRPWTATDWILGASSVLCILCTLRPDYDMLLPAASSAGSRQRAGSRGLFAMYTVSLPPRGFSGRARAGRETRVCQAVTANSRESEKPKERWGVVSSLPLAAAGQEGLHSCRLKQSIATPS